MPFNYWQVSPILQWLEANGSSLPENSDVIYSDASDTGIVGDASHIVQRFKGLPDLLYNLVLPIYSLL